MADEAVTGPEDAMELARLGAADVFALKIAKSGGTVRHAAHGGRRRCGRHRALWRHDAGRQRSVPSPRRAASARLPQLAWGTELFGPLLLKDDIVAERPPTATSRWHLPTGLRLGLALDEDKLAHYRRPGRLSGDRSPA